MSQDTQLRKALLTKEQLVGESQARYTQEAEIKEQEAEMRKKVAQFQAEAIRGEKYEENRFY